MRMVILTASVLALAACSQPAEAPAPADAPAATDAAQPASFDASAGGLLEADGLTPALPAGGTALKIPFGWTEAQVTEFLNGFWSRAPERGECADLGLTTLTYGADLDLLFEGGRFAGYYAGEDAPETFSTIGDIHVGSTLAEIRAANPEVQVTEGSVGPEFGVGEVFGFLSGTGDDARVTGLYAGRACIFR